MLGEKIYDPLRTESNHVELDGLKLLPIETTFNAEKFTRQTFIPELNFTFLNQNISARNLDGYEIHSGISSGQVSAVSCRGNIFGTYIHGIFDNDDFRRKVLNAVRLNKHLPPLESTRNVRAEKQKNYERLAKIVRESLNMTLLKEIMNQPLKC